MYIYLCYIILYCAVLYNVIYILILIISYDLFDVGNMLDNFKQHPRSSHVPCCKGEGPQRRRHGPPVAPWQPSQQPKHPKYRSYRSNNG